ncbi:MAG: peptidylprolyl isomerase [Bacteroidota bacterium]
MRTFVGILFLLFSFTVIGQTKQQLTTALANIDTRGKAETLIKDHPNWDIAVVKYGSYDEETPKKLLKLQEGQSEIIRSETDTYHYKLLDTWNETEFRVSYIHFNGRALQKTQIDSLRSLIIDAYKKRTPFETLVATYNMDSNPNKGDLGWFKPGVMVPEFEKAVRKHKKDAIFTVDVDNRKWYFVVLKTHANRVVNYRQFVKVKER